MTGVCSTRNLAMVRALAATRRALAPIGTLIPNGGKGGRWFGPLGRIVGAQVRSRFTRQRLRPFLSVEKHDDLRALAELVEAGAVTPAVDRAFPFERAADAIAYVGEGHARGKVVVTVGGSAGVAAIPQR